MTRGTFIKCRPDLLICIICGSAVCVMDHNKILQVEKGVHGNDVAERIGSQAAGVAGDQCFCGLLADVLGVDYVTIPP